MMSSPLSSLPAPSKCHKCHGPNSHAGFMHVLLCHSHHLRDASKLPSCPTAIRVCDGCDVFEGQGEERECNDEY